MAYSWFGILSFGFGLQILAGPLGASASAVVDLDDTLPDAGRRRELSQCSRSASRMPTRRFDTCTFAGPVPSATMRSSVRRRYLPDMRLGRERELCICATLSLWVA